MTHRFDIISLCIFSQNGTLKIIDRKKHIFKLAQVIYLFYTKFHMSIESHFDGQFVNKVLEKNGKLNATHCIMINI